MGKTSEELTIQNDDPERLPEFLAAAFAALDQVLDEDVPFYLFVPSVPAGTEFLLALRQIGWRHRQTLVWCKDAFVLGHGDYHNRHEAILYGFTEGNGRVGRGTGRSWYGGNDQASVLFYRPAVTVGGPRSNLAAGQPVTREALEDHEAAGGCGSRPPAESVLRLLFECLLERAADDLPAAVAGQVEIGELIGRADLFVAAGPVVDAGRADDRPAPRQQPSGRLEGSFVAWHVNEHSSTLTTSAGRQPELLSLTWEATVGLRLAVTTGRPELLEASIGNGLEGYRTAKLIDDGRSLEFDVDDPLEPSEVVVPDEPAWRACAAALTPLVRSVGAFPRRGPPGGGSRQDVVDAT